MTTNSGGPEGQNPNADWVRIFDTTLRDGEQCPGATMTFEEKLEVAELLDAMGVDIIEAGFPIASEGDFAAVNEIAKRAKNSVICGLSRAGFKDIDRCAEAIKPARRKSTRINSRNFSGMFWLLAISAERTGFGCPWRIASSNMARRAYSAFWETFIR